MRPVIAIVLAAGKGTRMRSDLPKPLVLLAGKPIIEYITGSFEQAGVTDISLIVGYKAGEIKKALGDRYLYIEQKEQKGTAHAVMQAKDKLVWNGKDVFVFVGDSPLIQSKTIAGLLAYHRVTGADCTFLTADFKMRLPYARVIKDREGNLVKCVEEKNASPEELKITELLSSHFLFKGELLFRHIGEVQPDRDNGELYLTDILEIFLRNGYKVETYSLENYEELVGLNTPEDVAWAEQIMKKRK